MRKQIAAIVLMQLCSVLIEAQIPVRNRIVGLNFEGGCTVHKTAKSDREFDCLKGKVHIIQSQMASVAKNDDQYVKEQITQERITTYDKKGNKTEEVFYGFDRNRNKYLQSRIVYNFNSKGKATGWEDYSVGRPIPDKCEYILDRKGNIVKQIINEANGRVRSILTLIYDLKGNNIEKRQDNISSNIGESKVINTFNGNGKLTQSISYSMDGSINHKTNFTYDNEGNKVEAVSYFVKADGDLLSSVKTSLSYDKKENIIERITYYRDFVHSKSIYDKFIYGYDKKGNLISTINYGEGGEVKSKTSATLELDSHGNWIKRISNSIIVVGTNTLESFRMESRTITYF